MTPSDESNLGSNDFAKDAIVFERFQILDRIASGAQGRVYLALDTLLDINVALKVLATDTITDRDLVRFQSEAKLASKMKHRNIATVFDFGLYDSTPFLSMEYVQGESLQEMLERDVVFDLADYLDIFLQVASALSHAHSRDIVHRDIKPANIVLSETDEGLLVKVLDFGIAKNLDPSEARSTLTPAGNIVGSPLYMSPEQAQSLPISAKSDNYSLGCVMWHCLVGSPPFASETAIETIMAHAHAEVPELNSAVLSSYGKTSVPEELTSLIRALLSKNPGERPSVQDDLIPALVHIRSDVLAQAEQLKRFSEPEVERDDDKVEKEEKKKKPTKTKYAALALLVVALSGTIGLILLDQTKQTLQQIPADFSAFGGAERTNLEEQEKPEQTNENYGTANIESDKHENEENEKGKSRKDQRTVLDRKAFFSDIGTLKIRYDASDAMMKKFARDKDIVSIDIADSSKITDEVFASLSTIPNLQTLNIGNTGVTTLSGIQNCSNLKHVTIGHTQITDGSLKNLLPLKQLTMLRLTECREITDRGIGFLAPTKIANLDLKETSVTKNIDRVLAPFPALVNVNLTSTAVDERTVRAIALKPTIDTITIKECSNIDESTLTRLENEYPFINFGRKSAPLAVLYQQGVAYEQNQNWKMALEQFSKVIALIEKHHRFQDERTDECYFKAGISAFRLKQYELSDKYFEKLRTNALQQTDHGRYVNALSTQAELYLAIGQKDRCLQLLQQAVSYEEKHIGSNKDSAARCQLLGLVYRNAKNYSMSIKWLERAIAEKSANYGPRSPQVAAAKVCLGDTLRLMKQDKKAMTEYQEALELFAGAGPNDPELPKCINAKASAYTVVAQLEYESGNHQKAMEYSDEAMKLIEYVQSAATVQNIKKQNLALRTFLNTANKQ